jgi:ketosteroid isomerase-like protein
VAFSRLQQCLRVSRLAVVQSASAKAPHFTLKQKRVHVVIASAHRKREHVGTGRAAHRPERDTGRPMSQENGELVRRAYEAWNQGGPEAATPFWAEDVEFHDPPNLPDSRVVRGRDAVAAYLTDQVDVVGDMKLTLVDLRVLGEAVVMRMEVTMKGAESGVDVPGEIGQIVEVADGRLHRIRMFMTWDEALEAAGLRE